ncbi:hypothetical protein BN59_02792 [Legionella massiliensis]|uniref:Uncharacterized protein n=1 Tax=Legionella massiliensis TaxID=1034943 RepID=A0A078KZS5_9GAMM|nr:hypothetical protein [Legionella massiliensis]CDZ78482.1 hypothetical protein BN59_02792 [Legionella massiliensis]CEE14220.1 hypothetical protein BN1094_02792 [Legionella massiliensis]
MKTNSILSVLFCRKNLSTIDSGIILLLQLVLLIELRLFLLAHQQQLFDKVLIFIAFVILFNLILVFCSKARYFFAYNNAFFISLWIFTLIIALEQLLLMLISPYLISEKIISLWTIYFLFYSAFAFIWGIMMFFNILVFFISKPPGR